MGRRFLAEILLQSKSILALVYKVIKLNKKYYQNLLRIIFLMDNSSYKLPCVSHF